MEPHQYRYGRIRDGSVDLKQFNSVDDLIGDQDRARRPLDKSLLDEALLRRWIRRRRAALRRAIAERTAAKARHHQAEEAEQVGRESLIVAERALLAFADVDMSLVQHRAEEFKRAATGAPRGATMQSPSPPGDRRRGSVTQVAI
jgi:hypothetical protein